MSSSSAAQAGTDPAASGAPASGLGGGQVPAPQLPTEPVVVARPPQQTPQQMAEQVIAEIPSLSPVRDALVSTLVCHTLYVGTDEYPALPITPDEALEELALAHNWTKATIDADTRAITELLANVWAEISVRFHEATAESVEAEVGGLEFSALTNRFKEENEEQDKLRAASRQLLGIIAQLREKLQLTSPAAAPSAPVSSDPPEEGRFAHSLRRFGGALVGTLVKEVDEPEPLPTLRGTAEDPRPDWLTPPVWDESDERIRRLKGLIHRRVMAAPSTDEAWKVLDNFNLPRAEVEVTINWAEDQVNKQLAQCDEVMTSVNDSFRGFSHEIEAVQRLGGVIRQVRDFFLTRPSVQAKSSPG